MCTVPQGDLFSRDIQFLTDFLNQCCVGRLRWDRDGKGEGETDFDNI